MTKILEAQRQAKLDVVREIYEQMKETEKFKASTVTQQKYLLALECGVTVPSLDRYLKDLGIKLQ